MAKQLVFSDEARRGILEGVTLLAKAVLLQPTWDYVLI